VALVRLAFFPEGTHQQYRALARAIGNPPPPPGRLAFASGPVPGGWQVVQIWRSRAELEAFNAAYLLPAMTHLGTAGFPRAPVVVDFEPVDLATSDLETIAD
jgi:hypothetical protein